MDWYCSGIRNELTEQEFNDLDSLAQESYLQMKNDFVSESFVTDEIRQDLLKLGWIVLDEELE